ncbi:MAG TPA: Dabb family protein [Humibacter sp.]|nr:Dabb family protein [Humibacter sp.]
MTLRHIVSWKMNGSDAAERAEQARTLRTRLLALEPVIDVIRSMQVGVNDAGPSDNFDVVLVADFDDEDALARYQVHPEHQKVGTFVRSVTAGRSCVDFTLA